MAESRRASTRSVPCWACQKPLSTASSSRRSTSTLAERAAAQARCSRRTESNVASMCFKYTKLGRWFTGKTGRMAAHSTLTDMVEPRELFRPDALRIDWMNRGYLPSVVAIERACVENAWLDADFVRCLRARDYFGQVALGPAGRLAGFCIYK